MKKHAYLIIAHNNFDQLSFLISLIDHPKNDIFIHIDKKVKDTTFESLRRKLSQQVKHSRVEFTDRVDVIWGHYSLIESEMILFEAASEAGDYCYYHLISGSDLPIVSQETIHNFFDKHSGKIFLTLVDDEILQNNNIFERVKYYHIFPMIHTRSNLPNLLFKFIRKLQRLFLYFQKVLHVNRLRRYNVQLGYASNWVSLDDSTVRVLLSEKDWIRKIFKNSIVCDELFVPTIINKNKLQDKIYYSVGVTDKQDEFQGNLRYINWWDGSPYEWTDSEKDLEQLRYAVSNGHFFSRKFDLEKYPKLKDFIIKLQNDES
ncbi:beta-1,6-N-acetylglucosaminyltransferase [Streptococcus sp. ZY19097]|uniref:beta-1,6-N-acetylglucosaminyltransferase n=1 Tax=Streptococcus sp. ZY19097 TaxID=3231906 RepID=UPI0034591AE9